MDVGIRTEDGFIETSARADDVLNVAGHRLSGGHIEQAIVESGKVSECAVVGLKDDVKGQQPFAFIVLNKAEENTEYVFEQISFLIYLTFSFKVQQILKKLL
jgi:propionyl-CoA synthetase